MAHGDFTTWVATNTISTSDNTTWGGGMIAPTSADFYTVKVEDWGVPAVTVPVEAIARIEESPMTALARMDQRLNRVRQRVAA